MLTHHSAGPRNSRRVRRRARAAKMLGTSLALAQLAGRALLTPLPSKSTLADRLAKFPTTGLPLSEPVSIYWNDHQIPFIEAKTDRDAAFALGLVHAHLRLGQMDLMRRVSQGRLAEIAGPLAVGIDHALRLIDLGKASRTVLAAMPSDKRAWLDAFVAGLNHHQSTVRPLPHEYRALGLKLRPWRPEELITIGRLGSIDVTWMIWFRLLGLRDTPNWAALWRRAINAGTASAPSFGAGASAELEAFEDLLSGAAKIGSNSFAVGASRSGTGSALIASDPHLGISLPNLWLIAGLKSPSYHFVGLMIPGLPFVAVGRNQDIAWGGTNLRAASSDLFDISTLSQGDISSRDETIAVRGWFNRKVKLSDSPHGPVISDAPVLPPRNGERLALRWIGHRPTDEMGAMLDVGRARNWNEFRSALSGFALSPQNFVYADRQGNIGQLTAAHLPSRPATPPEDIVRSLDDAIYWDRIVTSDDLPQIFNPPDGIVASANNRPADSEHLIGYFFSSNDRVLRLKERLRARRDWTEASIRMLQLDTHSRSALGLRDAILQRCPGLDRLGVDMPSRHLLDAMKVWDGVYDVSSRGALAFEILMSGFLGAIYDEKTRSILDAGGSLYDFAAQDVSRLGEAVVTAAISAGLPVAARTFARYRTWGAMHRLPIKHALGAIPFMGRRYRIADLPTAGSSHTVFKTAHSLESTRHNTRYGTQARHISDLSDPDANWFVLLGGQDGWFNNSTFADQVDPFMKGELIHVPMMLDTVRASFPHHLRLTT